MSEFNISMMRAVLAVTDVDQAIGFWERLGVARSWKSPSEPHGSIPTMAAGIGSNAFQLLLVKRDPQDIQPQTVSLVVRGLDACHATILKRAGDLTGSSASIGPITHRQWPGGGTREFATTDPWGHTVLYQENT